MLMSPVSVGATALDPHLLTQLRSRGFRCAPGRAATLQVLRACAPEHLTLDDIHQRIAELGWPADDTAVRRNLRAFTRCGLTHALAVPGPPAYGLADPPHHHVLCSTCGALTDLPVSALAAAIAAAQAATGYHLTRTGLTLTGHCPLCQQTSSPPVTSSPRDTSQRSEPSAWGRDTQLPDQPGSG